MADELKGSGIRQPVDPATKLRVYFAMRGKCEGVVKKMTREQLRLVLQALGEKLEVLPPELATELDSSDFRYLCILMEMPPTRNLLFGVVNKALGHPE